MGRRLRLGDKCLLCSRQSFSVTVRLAFFWREYLNLRTLAHEAQGNGPPDPPRPHFPASSWDSVWPITSLQPKHPPNTFPFSVNHPETVSAACNRGPALIQPVSRQRGAGGGQEGRAGDELTALTAITSLLSGAAHRCRAGGSGQTAQPLGMCPSRPYL